METICFADVFITSRTDYILYVLAPSPAGGGMSGLVSLVRFHSKFKRADVSNYTDYCAVVYSTSPKSLKIISSFSSVHSPNQR